MHLEGWVVGIVLVIGGAVALSHLGVDLGAVLAGLLHGLEHALNRPL